MMQFLRIWPALAAAVFAFSAGSTTEAAQAPGGGKMPRSSRQGVFATDSGGLFNADHGPAGVAAEVDNHRILLREVTSLCLRRSRAAVVDGMIQDYVLERACAKMGISVSEAEKDGEIALLREKVRPETLEAVLAQHQTTMPMLREAVLHKIQRRRIVADQVPPAKMVHCRAIFLRYDPPGVPAAIAGTVRTEAEAAAIIAAVQSQIQAGSSFGTLAAEYSQAAPKNTDGDFGILYPGLPGVDPAVLQAALALEKNAVSRPIHCYNGCWLLQAVSTNADFAPAEAAAYRAARAAFVDQQSQFLSPAFVVGLIEKSNITFASDAECSLTPGRPLPAAATVDGHPIPMQEVAARCLAADGPRTVDILIQNFLVDRECRRRHLSVSDEEIDQRIAALAKQIAPHTIAEGLTARHMTLAELRDGFRQDKERVLLVEDQVPPPKMTRCRILQITSAHRTEAAALALIRSLQDRLKHGEDFAALAARFSEADTKPDPGNIGIFYPGVNNVETSVLEAGLALNKGETTPQPVKTIAGYSLLQCLSTSRDHPRSEDAAYAAALQAYREQQSQTLASDEIVALLRKSHVVYYVHV